MSRSRTGQGGRSRRSPRLGVLPVVVLAVVQFAIMGWLLFEPLPNLGNILPEQDRQAGVTFERWMFLARLLPGVVPGVSWSQSHLGELVAGLSQVENLPQRLPIVLAAVLIAGAAVGMGEAVLRLLGVSGLFSRLERLPLAFGLGTIALGTSTLILGRLGMLDPWGFRTGLGVLCLLVAVSWMRDQRLGGRISSQGGLGAFVGLLLLTGPFLMLMALGALQPTIEYDALEYHLQGPKEYYQDGRITFLPHNVYASMPFQVEMLHLLGMVVLDDWWRGALVGQFLIACFAPATAALIALAAWRWGSGRAAWVAVLVYLTTPWVYLLARTPFVEGPLCFYHAALIGVVGLASMGWRGPVSSSSTNPSPSPLAGEGRGGGSGDRTQARDHSDTPHPNPPSQGGRGPEIAPFSTSLPRLWLLAGLLAGGAMACKYPGLVSAVIPFGIVAGIDAVRRKSLFIPLAFVLGVALAVGPWLVKNVIDTGNPVYPLAYNIFGGNDWNDELDAKWQRVHGPRPFHIEALKVGVLDVAGRSDWQSPLFVLLVPLAALRRGSGQFALALGIYVAYLFATWFLLTHRLERFWLPLLPAAAILAGLGADWTQRRSWTIVLAMLLSLVIPTNFALISPPLAGPNDWTADLDTLRVEVPAELNPPLARLDAMLPDDAKILLVGQASVFHMRTSVVYNTVFNRETIERIASDQTPDQVQRSLANLGITHLYVDWSEIDRYRSPGNYGFTPFVTPELFRGLVRAGVLEPVPLPGQRQELYRVRRSGG